MPRGKKRPISELIAEQEGVVVKRKEELEKAKSDLAELREIEKSELLDKVIQIAKDKNMTVEDLLNKVE